MIVNNLGNTGIGLSAVGLGFWAAGGGKYRFGWGEQDDNDSVKTVHRALDMGINWIDTAPVYGDGHSEEVLERALQGKRKDVVICTKCGLFVDEKKENLTANLDPKSIRLELELSLKRLNTDYIDLYLLHVPWGNIEEAWNTLAELKKEGKIRFAGASNFSKEELKRIQRIHPISVIQPQYHMLELYIEQEGILDYCGANNIGVVAFSPMCRGLLTGKMTKEKVSNLPNDDNRTTLPYYQEPDLSAHIRFIEDKLRPIADRNSRTLSQLAIAWVLRRSEVTSAIVGARNPRQIEETAPGGDWKLSKEDCDEIDKLLNIHHTYLNELKAKTNS